MLTNPVRNAWCPRVACCVVMWYRRVVWGEVWRGRAVIRGQRGGARKPVIYIEVE